MNEEERKAYEQQADIMKALAHPSRLLIVNELSYGERCVCELTERVGADISTVSKHLSVLRTAGIVECGRRGVKIFYRLRCPCVINFFNCIAAVQQENERRSVASGRRC